MANDVFGASQARPAAGVLTSLVATAGGAQKILTCLKCCNVGALAESINLFYGPNSVSPGKLIHSALAIQPNSTFTLCEGWVMYGFVDVLSVQSQFGNIVFTAFTDTTAGVPFNVETFKVLQSQPAVGVNGLLYQIPLSPTALGATATCLKICNTSASADTFTVYYDPGGSGAALNKAVHYQQPIAGNTTITLAEGWLMAPNDAIWVASGSGNVAYTLFLDQVS